MKKEPNKPKLFILILLLLEIVLYTPAFSQALLQSLCGEDDREQTSPVDNAVGRIETPQFVTGPCTGFITLSGAMLTAAHCFLEEGHIVEFNVPLSDNNGDMNPASAVDRYEISQVISNGGLSYVYTDWVLFEVAANSITGLTPIEAYGEFYRLQRWFGAEPNIFRVTGFGDNAGDPTLNRVQQTAVGGVNWHNVFTHEGNIIGFWYHYVDTEQSNSGSPIILDNTNIAVGIHNTAGCHNPNVGYNQGPSFRTEVLYEAINTYTGSNMVFVDANHPDTDGDGTLFEPFLDVQEAVNTVSAGGTIRFVEGTYPGAVTFNKAVTLDIPSGTAVIGGPGGSSKISGTNSGDDNDVKTGLPEATELFLLHDNYPNPFNPVTTIRYELNNKAPVTLEILDLLGRRVSVLVQEVQSPGVYQVQWNAVDAASGVYFYKITAGSSVEIKKMILMK